jgi:hypothetical protein
VAREVIKRCDVCGKPTERIVAKIQFIPMIPGVSRSVHSNYTHHADVGVCCEAKLLRGFKWRKRLTAAEYHDSRKAGTG